jgi:hypothetical protein
MLKKYTKYVATAFAVASLSTFIIGCGAEGDDGGDSPETPGGGTEDTNNAAPPPPGGE